ncbi:hypothetical protein [Zymomonas mobilis]|uniref:hypothetical protein n=1 Tax=Zymomonas mobilis TaxID=542 RepID=UPI0021AB18C6|nr:hypothetical protein [Zymomonas mobilis]
MNWKILSEDKSKAKSSLLQTVASELSAVDSHKASGEKADHSAIPMIKSSDSLASLKKAPAKAIVDLGPVGKDFVLLLGRREKDDQIGIVAMVEKDDEGLKALLKKL